MADRPCLSLPLEQVRIVLYPDLPREEGLALLEDAMAGDADVDTWRRIGELAVADPDLMTNLLSALRELQAARRREQGPEE